MEDSLEKLKEITNNLPRVVSFDDFVNFVDDEYIEYNVEHGRCFGLVLLSKKSVAVTRIFLEKDTIFPLNSAGVVTGLTVFRGKLDVHITGREKEVLSEGDSMSVPKEDEFGAIAVEDTWVITISVPRRGDYTLPPKYDGSGK